MPILIYLFALVVKIQRKWRILSTKKIFYKMMLRNFWKEKFTQCYLELKAENISFKMEDSMKISDQLKNRRLFSDKKFGNSIFSLEEEIFSKFMIGQFLILIRKIKKI